MISKVRSFLFFILLIPLSMIYGLVTLILRFFPHLLRHRITISWCSLALFLLRWVCGVRYRVLGKENYQRANGPYVVLSKHQSAWETFILQLLFFPGSTLLKKELLTIPFFGWGLKGLHPIAIDRSNPRQALKDVKVQGLAHLKNNINMIMFPEGTRVAPGERIKYARSGADIAIEAGVDIIPVAVNSGYCWPARKLTMSSGLITVVVGRPITSEKKTSRELTMEVEQWIENEMKALTVI